ncbi:MAG: Eco57I restriction-modification methylase domain-containing protein, partial [Candidatus Marinimicrobia bacterium]|nr:Eco57I restriction-modification methylase domain-containing protein [Candidatus Neomarinimicrobiota bacterium]
MIITKLIEKFSIDNLEQFFRNRLSNFKNIKEKYDYLFDTNEKIKNKFSDITKIGEADIKNSDDILVITAKTLTQLTNRSGKKMQYEIAKNILKEEDRDSAFFIFYDKYGKFRFSFIRANYIGSKRDFTSFKRYTYFVSKEQTNKTFIKQISEADFNDLDSIQDAFSVEPLTKQFYEKLQHWYFWAIDNVKFPDDAEEEKNGREIAIIRLITRLMFIWFMRVRDLIPENLFDEENINNILLNFADEESTYYKAILQNLFFATLNTKQKERKFRTEARFNKGFNPDFGNQNVFRYHDLFKDSKTLKTLFEKIPFLNGGLFECLDYRPRGKDKNEKKYIDGFTATKGQQPIVPNALFFSEPQKKDLSRFYKKKNKLYEVEGLINLLKSYNFTIDENEADDIEVALDPELLGSIFENLLASYNPETSTTARKATGSFYTPREIVNYMTNESLKQYFLTHLEKDDKLEDQLDTLIKAKTDENPFAETTSKKITNLINNLRVVDPAVGSGAFPMAVLNKLVFILSKIDPENKFWEQIQIDGTKYIPDHSSRKTAIASIKKQFREKNADYGRKLYLIEKCIYGVDIQQIAVEIAKLRFFISLLVDEKIEWDKPEENYGIEPLPNLDFKLMQGNSLISSFAGIDFDKTEEKKDNSLFDMDGADAELISKFEELKNEYQNESDREKKNDLREKIEKSIYKIVEDKIIPQIKNIDDKYANVPASSQKDKAITVEKQKLAKRLGFDIEQIEKDLKAFTEGRKPKDFFLWKIYFAEVFSHKGGFDIVIGNPPYIGEKGNKKTFVPLKNFSLGKRFYQGKMDIFYFFFHLGLDLLKIDGINSYITTNYYITATGAKNLRKDLKNRAAIMKMINFGEFKIFESASGQHNMITILQKGYDPQKEVWAAKVDRKGYLKNNGEIIQRVLAGNDEKTEYYNQTNKTVFYEDDNYIGFWPKEYTN